MTDSPQTVSSDRMWRWIVISWGVLALLSLGSHAVDALRYVIDPPLRVSESMHVLAGLVEQIQEKVPRDEAVLIDTWQPPSKGVAADQFLEREIAYWVFPRRVYSAAALRDAKRSLSEFIRNRDIRWGVRGLTLVPLDIETVDEKFSGEGLPDRFPEIEKMQVPKVLGHLGLSRWLRTIAALGLCLAAGWGGLHLLGLTSDLSGRWDQLALSWLVGLSLLGLLGLAGFLAGLRVSSTWTLIPLGVLGLVGGHVGLRRKLTVSSYQAGAPGVRLARWLLCGVVVTSLLVAVAGGIDGFDQRMQWAYKARLMLIEPGPFGADSVFQDPDHVHFHPRYPLLVPAAEAVLGSVAGGFREESAVLLFPMTLVAAAVLLAGGLSRLGMARPAIGGLMLLLLPAWAGLPGIRLSRAGLAFSQDSLAAFNACPELVLGTSLLAATVCGIEGWRGGRVGWFVLAGLFGVTAGLAKAEGCVHVAVSCGVAILLAWRAGRGPRRAVLLTGAAVLAVLAVHELVFTGRVVAGILPDDYRRLLTPAAAWDGIGRWPVIAGRFVLEAFLSPRFGGLGILLIVGLWRGGDRWRQAAVLWPLLTVAVMFDALCVPFLVIPDYVANLTWAAGRLFSELTPIAVWCLAVLVLPIADRPPPPPSLPTAD